MTGGTTKYYRALVDREAGPMVASKKPEIISFKVDAYVSTVCPRVAIDDASRFTVPVLTPVEFDIIKGLKKWDQLAFDEIRGD